MPDHKRKGYESKLFYGSAGTTAPTLLLRRKDLNIEHLPKYGDTTDCGDSSSAPHTDRGLVEMDCKITWSMTVKDNDPALPIFLAAGSNRAGTPIALKYVNAAGTTIFDGDCLLKWKDNSAKGDAAGYDFEAEPTTEGGREWFLIGV